VASDANPFLIVRGLQVHFGAVRAVDGVDMEVRKGEVMGLVGESGSGKTTVGRVILGLTAPTAGTFTFDGVDITRSRGRQRSDLRRRMQMIFQDPYSSLSPRMRVARLLTEPYVIHHVRKSDRLSAAELLETVGLSSDLAAKYPHELSGGQARRVGIARALALSPDLIVADEPTAGLDASAAASALNLMKSLRDRMGLTYLLITHNLNVLGYIADRISVMYLGRIVEVGTVDAIFDRAAHPYAIGLLSSVPEVGQRESSGRKFVPRGEIPSPSDPPSGCRFHPRCQLAKPICSQSEPQLELIEESHLAACHFWREGQAVGMAPSGGLLP
jgi:oligopeptide/dipeptide ABC transporter ATP-binding protein